MRILCALLIMIASPVVLFAGDFFLNQGYVDSQGFKVVLPYERVDGLVIVKATVGGKTRKFLLDTGAPTVITNSVQLNARFPLIDTIKTHDISNRKADAALVQLDELALGDLVVRDVPAIVTDSDNAAFRYLGVDGIIGSNLLRHMIVRISSANGTITFSDHIAASDALCFGTDMYTDRDRQSSPVIRVALGEGIVEDILFDSGYDGFLNVAADRVETLSQQKGLIVQGKETQRDAYGMYGAEEHVEKSRVAIPVYNLGGFIFRDVIALTTQSKFSRLGARLFACGDVTLDYLNGRFYIQPYDHSGSLSMLQQTEAYYLAASK